MWSMVRGLRSVALCGLVLGLAAAAVAAPGDLDPTFGAGGTVISDFGENSYTRAMALQADGKIVVTAARFTLGPQVFLVVRYTGDGVLDPTFGGGGTVATEFGRDTEPFALGVTPDDRIVVAGGGRGDLALARYLPDGRPDPSFGAGGTVTTDLGGLETIIGMALQPDGKIVVTGSAAILADPQNSIGVSEVLFGLARYTASGTLDASLGTGGGHAVDFFPWNLALQPDGKIVAVGHRNTDFVVVRVTGDPPAVSIGGSQGAPRPDEGATVPRSGGALTALSWAAAAWPGSGSGARGPD